MATPTGASRVTQRPAPTQVRVELTAAELELLTAAFPTEAGASPARLPVQALEDLVTARMAQAWDERGKARAQYLGPEDGHYEGCMGWDDCCCATYPNPYRAS